MLSLSVFSLSFSVVILVVVAVRVVAAVVVVAVGIVAFVVVVFDVVLSTFVVFLIVVVLVVVVIVLVVLVVDIVGNADYNHQDDNAATTTSFSMLTMTTLCERDQGSFPDWKTPRPRARVYYAIMLFCETVAYSEGLGGV